MSHFKQSEVIGNAFTVDGTRLTIHATDSTESALPAERVQAKHKGEVRWYTLEEKTSKTSKHWRDALANELCRKFLLLGKSTRMLRYHPYSNMISRAETQNVDFVLTNFPDGYHLYTHHVGTGRTYDDIRTDAYLYGGGYKFRSPKEALCHFAWLMSGKPLNRCRCKYDDTTWKRKQGPLNKAMEAEWKALLDARLKERFDTQQRGEIYHPPVPVGFNEASFLRPIEG
jgi:Transcription-silencing protein, cryptic loci regulator Clr2